MIPKMRPVKKPKRTSLVVLLLYKFTQQLLFTFIFNLKITEILTRKYQKRFQDSVFMLFFWMASIWI